MKNCVAINRYINMYAMILESIVYRNNVSAFVICHTGFITVYACVYS